MRILRYPPETLNQIRSSVHLPDLIQKYTKLNRRNIGLCPFHQEKHPSFSVDAKKGLWHCFGCGKGGDVFKFIMETEHLSFSNAVKSLAFEAGIRLPESTSVKAYLSKKWEEKKARLDRLDYLEELFKEYENSIYSYKRFEIRCLPSQEKRDSRDYLKEMLIEEDFDELERLVEQRGNLFEDMRKKVRNG
jgi:DNA primase catalytic core